MKKIASSVFVFFITAIALNAQSIADLWNTGQENTVIEIKMVGNNTYEGKTYSSDDASVPKGKTILRGLTKNGSMYKGEIFINRKKKWYDAIFVVTGNKLVITVSAGLTKKTIEWKLAN